MRIIDLLEKREIFLDLKARNQDELFANLSQLLQQNEIVEDGEEFVRELSKRESQGSTAVGNGVALPHARLKTLENIVICFIRLAEPIDFKSPDDKKVKLFFVIGTPLERVADYLKILARISKLIKNKELVNSLLEAHSEQQVLDLLEEFEEKST